ncbi:GspH/FimT family pseudopilin [Halomonas marinisediminis]|nr:GspH/FimT family pseudopilin [Halomonas marinisediminis]
MTAGDRQSCQGFTLIELLVTIAVAITLATVAVPSFQSVMARSQWASDYNQILGGLTLARSEAVKRRENVTLKVKSGGASWSYEVKDSGGSDLRVRASGNDRVSLLVADNFSVIFNSLGKVEGGSCDGGCEMKVESGKHCRLIDISSLGRIGRADCAEEGG